MLAETAQVWLGFSKLGERVYLEIDDLTGGVAVLGKGAERVNCLIAHDVGRSSEPVLVMDLSGTATRALSGYIETFDSSYVMKDAFKLDEEEPRYHGQLVASALSTIFNLPPNQESILNSMVDATASSDDYVSPSAIYGNVPSEGGRVTDRQDVQGRVANLHHLNATGELGSIEGLMKKGAIVCCARSPSPALGEASAAYILAKILAIQRRLELRLTLLVNDAHRIFHAQRFTDHSRKLQHTLLSSRMGKVLTTEMNREIDERVVAGCSARILSSTAWNDEEEKPLLSGFFMRKNISNGSALAFVPRKLEPRSGPVREGPSAPAPPRELTAEILETIQSNNLASRESVIAWLSPEYGKDAVASETERLINEQFIIVYRPEQGTEGIVTALRLTGLGEAELKRLRKNG